MINHNFFGRIQWDRVNQKSIYNITRICIIRYHMKLQLFPGNHQYLLQQCQDIKAVSWRAGLGQIHEKMSRSLFDLQIWVVLDVLQMWQNNHFNQFILEEKYWCFKYKFINSLWLRDAIWRHRSGSILAQVRACCLTASSHYLSQWWLEIIGIHPGAVSQKMHKICWQKLLFN